MGLDRVNASSRRRAVQGASGATRSMRSARGCSAHTRIEPASKQRRCETEQCHAVVTSCFPSCQRPVTQSLVPRPHAIALSPLRARARWVLNAFQPRPQPSTLPRPHMGCTHALHAFIPPDLPEPLPPGRTSAVVRCCGELFENGAEQGEDLHGKVSHSSRGGVQNGQGSSG